MTNLSESETVIAAGDDVYVTNASDVVVAEGIVTRFVGGRAYVFCDWDAGTRLFPVRWLRSMEWEC